jgi:hypothetical protein
VLGERRCPLDFTPYGLVDYLDGTDSGDGAAGLVGLHLFLEVLRPFQALGLGLPRVAGRVPELRLWG